MNIRAGVTVLALVLIAACASQPGAAPEVTLSQISALPGLRVESASGLPIEYRLRINNPLVYSVTLVSIEIESVGSSGAYMMNRVRHSFSRIISAKSSDTVDFRAWVYPLQRDTRGDVVNPVMLRGTARFQTPSGVMRTNFFSRGR